MTDQQIDARIARALRMLFDDYFGGSSIIAAFRNVAARLEADAELEAALREWVAHFDGLDQNSRLGDPIAKLRRDIHGARLDRSRAALARAGRTA